ncbi:hypothetical protein [Candidatus Sororendozoicomonas aggregata]|uniref:hypothetical protein n=1 Tax=Candidatus Sororendozoicomonas aggregata TaxID=3073239 RepID=UPI002ED4159D
MPNAKKPAITQFTGSLPNQTSAESTAVILSGNPTDVAKQLNTEKPGFLSDTGSDVTITVSPEQNQVRVVVTSTSTHSSQPEQRVNTVTAMAGFLAASHLTFVDNEYNKAVHYINNTADSF